MPKTRALHVSILVLASALAFSWRAARAQAPSNRYEIRGDTVYDTRTMLTWQRTALKNVALADVDRSCPSGFRAPTIKELQTLVAAGSSPAIDTTVFRDGAGGFVWSSTYSVEPPGLRWSVYFDLGLTLPNDAPAPLRCVR
jgi:hypothetical protein